MTHIALHQCDGRCHTARMTDPQEGSSERSHVPPPMPAATRRQYVKSAVLLAVTAVSLYLLLPGLISVFSSWRSLEHLDWPFAVLVLLFEVASSFCLWEVDRIALWTRWMTLLWFEAAGYGVVPSGEGFERGDPRGPQLRSRLPRTLGPTRSMAKPRLCLPGSNLSEAIQWPLVLPPLLVASFHPSRRGPTVLAGQQGVGSSRGRSRLRRAATT